MSRTNGKMPLRILKYINKGKSKENIIYTEQDISPFRFLKKTSFPMATPIYGLYFICCIGGYKTIVAEQMNKVLKSGLFHKTNKIVCFICQYKPDILDILRPYLSKMILVTSEENLFERHALLNFHSHLPVHTTPYYLYYFHTKGVSRKEELYHNRRRNLDYFILEQHEACLFWLNQNYDAVGTTLSLFPSLHFSGNFWWARSSHLQRLPREMNASYLAPEMYVCSLPDGKYISVCQKTNDTAYEELSKQTKQIILQESTRVPISNTFCRNLQF